VQYNCMRILCLTPWFPHVPGAQSGNFIYDSVNSLIASGHELKVLVAQPWCPRFAGWLHKDWRRQALRVECHDPVLRLELAKYLTIPRNYLRNVSNWMMVNQIGPVIERAINVFSPDVILSHTEISSMAALDAGKAMHIPVVAVMHGINTAPRLNTRSQLHVTVRVIDAADRVVLVGQTLKDHFSSISSRMDHFRVVYNGVKPPVIGKTSIHKSKEDITNIISVSNLVEGKGVDLNLEALGLLFKEGRTNWSYTIVGDGNQRTVLESMTRRLGLEGHVTFIGAVNHDEVYEFLSVADVFVLPSYREAFGVAYLEAMASGLPTIGVQGQGPEAFITHGETGFLVKPRDVNDLKDHIRSCLELTEDVKTIALNGQKFVRENFTWNRHAEQLTKVLLEVV